jgi:hypothetical protein
MKKRVLRIVAGIFAVGLLLGVIALVAITWHINRAVRECCCVAQKAHPHPGDNVTALIVFVNSDSHSLRERNSAVWALGRLRDPKALPALESFYNGAGCDHDEKLCQHELEKAIRLCGGAPKLRRAAGR